MDFKTLKTFHKIVACGSFNRAAEELNYAQSTVTMQIKKLEEDLGIRLLERGKTFRLTEAGRLFFEESSHIVKNMDHLQHHMADLLLGEAGNIRLGAVEPIASCELPRILGRFLADYPKIRVSVDIANSSALGERLVQGSLDLAVCSTPAMGTDLYFEPLYAEELVVLLPEGHPAGNNERIHLKDLREHRLLITANNCTYRKKVEIAFQELPGSQMNTMEIGSMTALKNYVAAGLGVALIPKSIVSPPPPGTIVRFIGDDPISVTFGILCKTASFPLKQADAKLYQYLKQELGEPKKPSG
ncbi:MULTISPECIES: LysR family transcriptional regulator [Bacillus]|uniref:LysR family transcriptional regulator n=1 Tax=Bacillus TaxID=1386 RepID=UPI002242EF6B|nr:MULTISPECIES: LysR family transcriptional regulator [Bacillus]MDN5387685.1 LysR family transcriptional regulator [Bacillus sp. LB7]MEC1023027.1 LysR family transcriptional regulator [Bacillus paralicheniformis]MEC1028124.1 LysR family transcriptional regulator [Bacillus paralicheniformis]MEC1035619.1 LysR family transcriptional regulator [Bacillus paralicheniformis]MEC1051515.1 LysR family transcriptional regulator [Bacillus paralicheniformis]